MFTALVILLSAAPVRTLRVSPVDRDGKPTECVSGRCGLELMRDGRVFSARHSGSLIFGPGLSLRSKRDGPVVFEKEKSGKLVGAGPYRAPEAVQMLFCELSEGPVLRCRHVRDASSRKMDCVEAVEARVVGNDVVLSVPGLPTSQVVARVEMAGADAETALFLYALRLIDADTDHHLPYEDRWFNE